MATIPKTKTLTKNSVDILNAIRNGASTNYRDYVPQAENSLASIKEIGGIIMQFPALQNEFLSALINRIGRVMITSKMYSNPWTVFKQGVLEFGETIEEIFVNIAKPFEYDVETSESKVFAREIPDVRSAFHSINYQKFYKATIQNKQLSQAFLSWEGITDLITKIVNSMYAGANYDEFQTMKYMLAKNILNGRLYPVTVPAISETNMKRVASTIKGVSNNYEFMSTKYNVAGVSNYADKDSQYLIVNSNFDAIMDVEVLASAFNMDKAEFTGHRVLVDSFGTMDVERLNKLFANDKTYTAFTDDELTALNEIPAVLVDKNWFMIFDNLYEFTEQYNGEGLYWNYWYHIWKTFSVSPFANASVFVPDVPSVTSVTISPSTLTTVAGQDVQLSVDVVTKNFAPKSVIWSTDITDGVSVDIFGKVSIGASVAKGTTITVTATSTFDKTKTGTATITVE
jgi:uncharacterized protein YjdB